MRGGGAGVEIESVVRVAEFEVFDEVLEFLRGNERHRGTIVNQLNTRSRMLMGARI